MDEKDRETLIKLGERIEHLVGKVDELVGKLDKMGDQFASKDALIAFQALCTERRCAITDREANLVTKPELKLVDDRLVLVQRILGVIGTAIGLSLIAAAMKFITAK